MKQAKSNDPPGTRRLRPKLAASLILTRTRAGGEVELLLGRRSGGHVFMPRKYVFPGGRVDRGDGFAPLATEPREPVRAVLTRAMSERRARAAAAAALRETAEETGLLIAEPARMDSPKPAWRAFAEAGAAPAADALDVVARAITPPGRPRRFDAWFFRTDVERVHGETEPVASEELDDLRWVSLDEAHGLDIPIITRFVLEELKRRTADPEAPVRCARVTRKGPRFDEI
ncbi:NUDIX domain-containing protein [Marinicauda salina]|uniref:NUDIX domain-containing protein n=1 Tax=Marinicauda salina TaxID=2135793 RepID=A0A2U2BR51_9PROT|nr:NUDIX domain-containing protein [Marinicauda salina]PWE16475.1 NUDIX domain-containing protein [Marinicauda salina]